MRLVSEADRLEARLIVVGNRRVQGPARILGSIARTVAANASCDVYVANTRQNWHLFEPPSAAKGASRPTSKSSGLPDGRCRLTLRHECVNEVPALWTVDSCSDGC